MTPKEFSKLNPEQRRIKIAEACGWLRNNQAGDELDLITPRWRPPVRTGWEHANIAAVSLALLPDYLNDLNAMHEAVKTIPINSEARGKYVKALHEITNAEMWGSADALEATAAQRADAFLLTV